MKSHSVHPILPPSLLRALCKNRPSNNFSLEQLEVRCVGQGVCCADVSQLLDICSKEPSDFGRVTVRISVVWKILLDTLLETKGNWIGECHHWHGLVSGDWLRLIECNGSVQDTKRSTGFIVVGVAGRHNFCGVPVRFASNEGRRKPVIVDIDGDALFGVVDCLLGVLVSSCFLK